MDGIYRFDDADEVLTFMPTAVRRALDIAGKKLSLAEWQKTPLQTKRALVALGAADAVDVAAVTALLPGVPAIEPVADPAACPARVPPERWAALRPLDRYAIVKSAGKPEKLERVLAEILGT